MVPLSHAVRGDGRESYGCVCGWRRGKVICRKHITVYVYRAFLQSGVTQFLAMIVLKVTLEEKAGK